MPIMREADGLAMSRCALAWGGGGGQARPPLRTPQPTQSAGRAVSAAASTPQPSAPARPAKRSRNAMLLPGERVRAPCIHAALKAAAAAARAGECTGADELQRQVAEAVATGGGRVDYVEVVDAATLRVGGKWLVCMVGRAGV